MTQHICLWSGPRNVSTALMYSFAQRDDVRVVDEPLYGHYLRVSQAPHPGSDDVQRAMNCDGNAVMRELLQRPTSARLFLKHMAHHLVDLDLGFLERTCNVFLIRDPREMLPSLHIQLPDARLADTSLKQQWELFSDLSAVGQDPAVLDSRELLLDPESVLRRLCEKLGLGFQKRMLQWQAGPRKEDGVWAPHWYHAVHASSGFAPYVPKQGFPKQLQPLLNECNPWYEKLYEHAIRVTPSGDRIESR
ncbi:MAG: hypothetical protein WBN09_10460 [Woeseiaceae bacterium]